MRLMFYPHLQRLGLLVMLTAAGAVPAVAEPDPVREFHRRHDQVDLRKPGEMMELAAWAEAQGLPWRAAKLYRRTLDQAPDHEGAYERLLAIAEEERLAAEPDRRERLLGQLGEGFKLHVTPHFLIAYNTERSWALSRGALLEQTHGVFFRAFRRLGLKPLPLERRLVCVLFETDGQFVQYARDADRMNMDWSDGYYSTRTNRIAFFDDRSGAGFTKARRRIETLRQDVAELKRERRGARTQGDPSLARMYQLQIADMHRQINWYRNRRDALAKLSNASKTTHECAHQLAFNTGIQRQGVQYPFWLSEGLASNFESPGPGRSFGPYRPNLDRRRTLQEAAREGRLMPLDKLVGWIGPPADDSERTVALYAQSWALFHMLFRQHREAMCEYLRALEKLPPGPHSPERLRRIFKEAFGSISKIDRRWQMYLRQFR